MSVSAMPDGASSMYLAHLLTSAIAERLEAEGDTSARTGARWLARNATDPETGETVISPQSANDLLTTPRSGWLAKRTITAIAALLFSGDESILYIANAVSIGLRPPRTGGGSFAATLPSWVDELSPAERAHARDYFYIVGRAHGLTD